MLTEADLSQFIGTENYYRHGFMRTFLYTDGVAYMAKEGKAYWLIDAIASHQINPKVRRNPRLQEFQLWELKVTDGTAVLTCRADSGERAVVTQKIEYTDFPLSEIAFYVEPYGNEKVLMLRSEH